MTFSYNKLKFIENVWKLVKTFKVFFYDKQENAFDIW